MYSKFFSKSTQIIFFSILLNNYGFGQTYNVVVILSDNITVKQCQKDLKHHEGVSDGNRIK